MYVVCACHKWLKIAILNQIQNYILLCSRIENTIGNP